jgi:ribosomal-protein-alanine N-acetyltransferase
VAQDFYILQNEGVQTKPLWFWSLGQFDLEINSENSSIFLWTASQNLQGFVMYRVILDEVEIMNLAVRNKGQGNGKKLLASFLKDLSLKSTKFIFLDVASENFAALNLYASQGFRRVGLRSRYYGSQLDAVQMRFEF